MGPELSGSAVDLELVGSKGNRPWRKSPWGRRGMALSPTELSGKARRIRGLYLM